jgi:small subunit ribosomal protein S1
VSHTKTWDNTPEKGEENETKKAEKAVEKKAVKKVKENVEKTTLGDISALSDLKSEMEENERNKKK